ncbi:MAG: hypothetical protein IKZ44_01680 [Clostridia bacterium]|nr:hypothetical protein [Clostridia bacterium]
MLCILVPLAAFFTGIGIFAWTRKKPMWFWSGSTVKESEITDVPAYNRANGIMWICFSLIYWVAAVLGIFNVKVVGVVIGAGTLIGIVALIFVYKAIYNKYRR